MKKILILLVLLHLLPSKALPSGVDSLVYGAFGKVYIYKPAAEPAAIVLFVSGDGGWNEGVVDMAGIMSSMNAVVIGIDIVRYYKNLRKTAVKCYYPASDFENLSLFVQKKMGFRQYLKPVLAGYSSGATLVYGLLAQAPANTFKGAIALGFCQDIEIDRPLCDGSGLKSKVLKPGVSFDLEACDNLSALFIVLQGIDDQVCDHQSTSDFLKGLRNVEIISLPKVGHGFSVQKNWVPQFTEAFSKILQTPGLYGQKTIAPTGNQEPRSGFDLVSDLPVIAVPTDKKDTMPMVLMISGDGGWTGWDQSLAEEFTAKGYPVAGLDSQKYFWEKKDPGTVANDLENVLNYFTAQWNRRSFLLVGYSFGANVVPFVATRLKPVLKEKVRLVAMLSPDPRADFEIHIADMLDIGSDEGQYDIVEEVKKLNHTPVLCIFGEEEEGSGEESFRLLHVRLADLPGSHHYKDNFPLIVESVLQSVR
jgi:type IV secretory pathway VirJ component